MSADHAAPRRSPAWPADELWHLAMPEGTLYDALASYKAPRAVVFVDELPRTASNKINWRQLQDAEWGRTA